MKLSKVIEKLENDGCISDYYIHRNAVNGALELNIEFKRDNDDKLLLDNIKEKDMCAIWE